MARWERARVRLICMKKIAMEISDLLRRSHEKEKEWRLQEQVVVIIWILETVIINIIAHMKEAVFRCIRHGAQTLKLHRELWARISITITITTTSDRVLVNLKDHRFIIITITIIINNNIFLLCSNPNRRSPCMVWINFRHLQRWIHRLRMMTRELVWWVNKDNQLNRDCFMMSKNNFFCAIDYYFVVCSPPSSLLLFFLSKYVFSIVVDFRFYVFIIIIIILCVTTSFFYCVCRF